MKRGLKKLQKPTAVLAFLLMAEFAAADERTTAAVSAAVSLLLAPPSEPRPGHWVCIGPSRIHAPDQGSGTLDAVGRLTTIAVDPSNNRIIYAGSAGQLGHQGCGVWKTTDAGQTWVPISDSLPTLSIGAIAIDPTNSNRIYIVTADEGLYRSDNAGLKWEKVCADLNIRTNTVNGDRAVLLINPKDPKILYVTSDNGVLRSTNSGKTWQTSLDMGGASSLVMDPSNPKILYAAIIGQGIYKTVDGGTPTLTASPCATPAATPAGWCLQTQGISYTNMLPATILLAITHPSAATSEIVYALLPNTTGAFDLFRTTDGGTNWSKQYTPASLTFCTVMGVDPVDWQTLYLGGPFFWISSDGGKNFTKVPLTGNDRQPASAHGDYWELVVDPKDSATLYAGSDGGIFRSTDHGKENTWQFIGEGITNVEMYDLALANTWSSRAISGIQDNGVILYNGTLVWQQLSGGDGAAVAIDATNADRFYAVLNNSGSPNVSSDGGGTFPDFSNGLPKDSKGNTPCFIWDMTSHLLIHPGNSKTLLEPCQSLWRTTTNAPPGNWVSIFTPPTGEKVVRSAVDPKSDIYFAGTDHGHIYAALGGAGWKQPLFSNPESLYVSDIEVDKAHTDTVYVSFAPPYSFVRAVPWERNCSANAGSHRIYQLKTKISSGKISVNAVDITANLRSDVCVNALAVDPFTSSTIYAATNKGVYRGKGGATAGSWTWQSYNDGMPLADVRDLEVHPITGNIFAATFGRSAFRVVPERPSSQ
jgi:photosystem II stability/assembly factor-like uncharacterized protein